VKTGVEFRRLQNFKLPRSTRRRAHSKRRHN
jgi:hypothetical protein